jgi:DNA-directed RNA polymerase specialized sigma24 family protein
MSSSDSTSWTLILAAASRAPAEQARFTERYAPVIEAYLVSRLGVPSEHEDVREAIQEVFLQCFKQGGALQGVDPARDGFRAFLYGVTRNVALMAERRRARRRERQPPHSGVFERSTDDATLSHVFDAAWAELVVGEARALVEERATRRGGRAVLRAKALELMYRDDLPPREIAPLLVVEVKEVYKLLETGRMEFRAAVLQVMARYSPEATRPELERKCVTLLDRLGGGSGR